MPRCVAIGCNNNGNHSFPKDLQLKKLWERATNIRNFTASKNSRLCSNHFKETDFQGISDATGLPQVHRYLKKTVIPSVFAWNKATTSIAAARAQRYLQRSSRKEFIPSTSQKLSFDDAIQVIPEEAEHLPEVPDFHEMAVTTADLSAPTTAQNTTSTQTPHILRLISFEDMLSDSRSVLFYTGLENINKFYLILSKLLPMANHLNFRGSQVINVTVEDQLLLMLIKLRRNKHDFELSKIFGISTTEVSNIFITWVNFVYELWSQGNIWPSRALVDYYMPESFKQHDPNTRVIVDGTEIFIANPNNPISQQATFEHKNVSIHTLTFLKSLTQLPGIKLKHDHHLAKNRIHIERLIRLTKTFKILNSNVNADYVPLLSRIFFICVMLCKFKEGIVK